VRRASAAGAAGVWPNDILLGGRKAGGILVESAGRRLAGLCSVGIGLNVSAPPPEQVFPAAAEAGRRLTADAGGGHLDALAAHYAG
jgi:BirA family biotin operon repressor/biotin-[acetyl-CoA-carboxylase] ligase